MAKYPVYKESDLHQTEYRNFDEALMPATVLYHPSGVYNDCRRQWQGIPGIERTEKGRIYIDYYSPEDLYRFEEMLDVLENEDRR